MDTAPGQGSGGVAEQGRAVVVLRRPLPPQSGAPHRGKGGGRRLSPVSNEVACRLDAVVVQKKRDVTIVVPHALLVVERRTIRSKAQLVTWFKAQRPGQSWRMEVRSTLLVRSECGVFALGEDSDRRCWYAC